MSERTVSDPCPDHVRSAFGPTTPLCCCVDVHVAAGRSSRRTSKETARSSAAPVEPSHRGTGAVEALAPTTIAGSPDDHRSTDDHNRRCHSGRTV